MLRDIIERSDYRDVILPMVLLRRIDVLLEKSKQQVLEASKSNQEQRKRLGITASPDADDKQLFSVSGYNFYNLHDKMLKELPTGYEGNPNGLYEEIKVYVSKFSKDIRDIIEKADLLDKLKTLTLSKSALHLLIKKFTDKSINLSNEATEDVNGNILPAMTNADMGMILEELVRKFNEANNGTAGEHFTPRDAVELLSRLIFEPVEKLPASISIYDPACGTGGMLTASHEYLINNKNVKDEAIRLSGNEINSQSYAICKADMIIKGSRSDQIRNCNTILDNDQDKEGNRFGYIISNPPYGKSWKNEQKSICNGKEFKSGKFTYELYNFKGITVEATKAPSVSDGQLLFLQ